MDGGTHRRAGSWRGRWQTGEWVPPCRASWARPGGQAHLGDLSGPEKDPDLLNGPRVGTVQGSGPKGPARRGPEASIRSGTEVWRNQERVLPMR